MGDHHTPLDCPFNALDGTQCGDWCPQFDLQVEDISNYNETTRVKSHTTLTLHCTGRRMILDQEGGVTASRNIRGS